MHLFFEFVYIFIFLITLIFLLIKHNNEKGLFKQRKVKEKYIRNYEHSVQIGKNIQKYNHHFSETFFITWVQTMFLRYSFLISYNQVDRIAQFEKIHFIEGFDKNKRKLLDLYNKYDDLQMNFVDLIEFRHNDENDFLSLKLSITGIGEKGVEYQDPIKEQFTNIFSISFKKNNDKDSKNFNFKSNCPNCGAPTNIVTYGICDHCQELVSIYDNVWKIVDISLDE